MPISKDSALIGKIRNILTKDAFQRTIYSFGFLLWTIIMWDSLMNFPFSTSSLKVSYLTLYMIPATILIIQVIRNNKLLWLLTFGIFNGYILVSIFFVSWNIIERSGKHVKAINWSFIDIVFLILFFGFLGIIDWMIYQLKPKRLI